MLVNIDEMNKKEIKVHYDMANIAKEFMEYLDNNLNIRAVIGGIFNVVYYNKNKPITKDTILDIIDAIEEYSKKEIYVKDIDILYKIVREVWQPIRSIEIRYSSNLWYLDFIDLENGFMYMKR